jgi:hypothetical protein
VLLAYHEDTFSQSAAGRTERTVTLKAIEEIFEDRLVEMQENRKLGKW